MPTPPASPRRDPKLRLALHLANVYSMRAPPPDPVVVTLEQVLHRTRRLQRLADHHHRCITRSWTAGMRHVRHRISGELRDLQYLLASIDRCTPVAPTPPTVAAVYRDLLALAEEFDGVEIAGDLTAVSVVTPAIVLDDIPLGRFRLRVDIGRLSRGCFDGDAVTAEALDPNPAACNDEVVHPHVQGGCICFGEGSPLLRAALAEGRLYDALVITRQVLGTYNEASPYVRLDQWSGRRCDECDDLVAEDELYGCSDCGTSLCSGCERVCVDCEQSHCRRCLSEDSGELICSTCLAEREKRAEEDEADDEIEIEDEPEAESQNLHPLPLETDHAQATP